MNDWNGKPTRNRAPHCSAHRLAEQDNSYRSSATEVGAILGTRRAVSSLLLEFQFFCNRLAAAFSAGRAAVDEVRR
jgi:hypothetical protein